MRVSFLSTLLVAGAAIASPAIAQDDPMSRPAEMPDLERTSVYEKDGVSFKLPGNWTVSSSEPMPDVPGGRALFLHANKAGIEGLALEASIQIFDDASAPTLEGAADFLVDNYQQISTGFTDPVIAPYELDGRFPALSARYDHTIFGEESPQAKRLDLFAMKPCGQGWTCLLISQSLGANEKAARATLGFIYGDLKYAP